MSSINKKNVVTTEEGGRAYNITSAQELRRTVASCMLWEDGFYEDGESIAVRIKNLVSKVDPLFTSNLAIEARTSMKLRHVPLLLVRELARQHYDRVDTLLYDVIQRPDEITEFMSIYWKDGKCPISARVKKGLAKAFTKFNEYQLAKYNRNKGITLKDVLFMVHGKPLNDDQESLWKKLINGTLESPETWEVMLSSGKDKKESWEYLLREKKLGGLALLRNLRNMKDADVDENLIESAIKNMNTDKILPFRFISAYNNNDSFSDVIEQRLMDTIKDVEKLNGETIVLVDVSGSMSAPLSNKSEVTRQDTASGLALLLKEVCETTRIFTFSNTLVEIRKSLHGFNIIDGCEESQFHTSTDLGKALKLIFKSEDDIKESNNGFKRPVSKGFKIIESGLNLRPTRLIVITDEQSSDNVKFHKSWCKNSYIINVATNKRGLDYKKFVHINGFSESTINWIAEYERGLK